MVVVSIVIPVHNGLQYTKQCIESIWRHTPNDKYEVIIINNGSDEETKQYLRELQNVQVLFNEENLGFAKAVNQGIKKSKGQYVFLLNNDTVLFPGWLGRMLEAFNEETGAVGPVSNFVMGKQQVRVARRLATPQQIHNIVSAHNRGQVEEAELLIGFALMIPRKILDEIGLFDERFFAGSEDLDYSLRLRRAGYKLKIAMDVFVYHKGSCTSKQILNKHDEFLEQSVATFCEKWSEELGVKIENHRQAFEAALGTKQPPITIAAIVKNEGRLMKNMIKVTNRFCDDYCIVDTGSTDDTVTMLRALLLNNGKVLEHEWEDDFAAARNFGLKYCRGKWILQLDADEVIDKRYASLMRRLIEQDECSALRFTIINFRESPFLIDNPKTDRLTSIRMWRNDSQVKYEGIVHETVSESVKAAGLKVAESPVPIYHFAYLKSPARHFELMKKATAAEPKRSNTHYFLGEQYLLRGNLEAAANCFKNAIETVKTYKGEGAYTSKVKQMLEVTEAVLKGQSIERFSKDVINHFEFLVQG